MKDIADNKTSDLLPSAKRGRGKPKKYTDETARKAARAEAARARRSKEKTMTEFEKIQSKNADVIHTLDYFGLANVTHMSDEHLRKFNVLLDHWQKISADELLKRNTKRMNDLDDQDKGLPI